MQNKADVLSFHLKATTSMLIVIGLLALLTASSLKGIEIASDQYYFLKKQLLGISIGFVIMSIIHRAPFVWIERLTLPITLVSLLSLCLIFVPGLYAKVGGASRWLMLGPLRFQTSEVAKLSLILFLAKNLSRPTCQHDNFFSVMLPNLAAVGTFCALLLKQPDFGSSALLTGVTFVLLFVSGARLRFLYLCCGAALAAFIALIVSSPYRLERLLSFLDPWSKLHSGGFQIVQSYLAMQNGGFLGLGLGESKQKLFFLPEAHSDFILSVIAEEMGLLGFLVVCCLYAYLFFLGIRISLNQRAKFKKLLCFGLSSLIAMQALFNIGVITGLLPTKGISLPFISYGASSMVVSLTMIGLITKINHETVKSPYET